MPRETSKNLVLITDFPWKYSKPGPAVGKGAIGHYPCMSPAEVKETFKKIAVVTIDFENVAIFNWVVNPRLPLFFECAELLKSFGYRYATMPFTWIKLNKDGTPFKGIGNYTGANSESVYLLVKGSMPPKEKLVHSVILSERQKHSEKPDEVKNRIERMYPPSENHLVGIFEREETPNWRSMGNEINGKNILSELELIKELK